MLACTHYTFARPAIEQVVGTSSAIVDPAEAVARQVARVDMGAGSGHTVAVTTGSAAEFSARVAELGVLAFDRVEER